MSNYTVSLPLIQGPDLIDALTSFCDDDRLSSDEHKALMVLIASVESEYNRKAEETIK
jgi:hypothetical protein